MDKSFINGTYIRDTNNADDRPDEIFFRCTFCRQPVERQFSYLTKGHSVACFECQAIFEVEEISQLQNTVILSVDRSRTPVGRLLEIYNHQLKLSL